jgi:coenzyme F420 hydrogenase subunit beta
MSATDIKDLIKSNLCTGCGMCVSESNRTLKMEWSDFGFIEPSEIDNPIPENAIKVCPFNPEPEEEVKDEDRLAELFLKNATKHDDKLGRFENTYAGYSNEYRESSSSGGIATYVFEQLLIRKVVDFLYVVKEKEGSYEYQLYHNPDDIKRISKSRYIPVTMEKLFLEINNLEGKVAISGVACFVKAIRLKQHYNPQLKEKIPFVVGIMCGGWKSTFFTDFLAQSSGINSEYHKPEYRLKDSNSPATDYSFGAFDEKDQFSQMKMSTVGDMWGTGMFKSRACDFCTDVATELADISLGDAWLPEYYSDGMGTSVIITRSPLADLIIEEGIRANELTVSPVLKEKVIQSQRASFMHRRTALSFRMKMNKLNGLLLPNIRTRVLGRITFTYAVVQFLRNLVRGRSLVYWHKTRDINRFNQKMKPFLLVLKLATKVYHKFR